jgi:hypothetical protein
MMKNLRDNWNMPNDVGVIYNKNNKKDGEMATKLQSAWKWIRPKKRPPKGSPWQILMEDWIIDKLFWVEWWLKKKGS